MGECISGGPIQHYFNIHPTCVNIPGLPYGSLDSTELSADAQESIQREVRSRVILPQGVSKSKFVTPYAAYRSGTMDQSQQRWEITTKMTVFLMTLRVTCSEQCLLEYMIVTQRAHRWLGRSKRSLHKWTFRRLKMCLFACSAVKIVGWGTDNGTAYWKVYTHKVLAGFSHFVHAGGQQLGCTTHMLTSNASTNSLQLFRYRLLSWRIDDSKVDPIC